MGEEGAGWRQGLARAGPSGRGRAGRRRLGGGSAALLLPGDHARPPELALATRSLPLLPHGGPGPGPGRRSQRLEATAAAHPAEAPGPGVPSPPHPRRPDRAEQPPGASSWPRYRHGAHDGKRTP